MRSILVCRVVRRTCFVGRRSRSEPRTSGVKEGPIREPSLAGIPSARARISESWKGRLPPERRVWSRTLTAPSHDDDCLQALCLDYEPDTTRAKQSRDEKLVAVLHTGDERTARIAAAALPI